MVKPPSVRRAEWALWAWTAWQTAFGIAQLYRPLQGLALEMMTQAQAMTGISLEQIRPQIVAAYVIAAASMAWVIWRLGAGKRWARATILITFILEALLALGDLGGPLTELLADVPNLGLQAYALVLLYREPARSWFQPATASARAG